MAFDPAPVAVLVVVGAARPEIVVVAVLFAPDMMWVVVVESANRHTERILPERSFQGMRHPYLWIGLGRFSAGASTGYYCCVRY